MKTWHGGCHCGALGFEFRTALAPSAWSIRACQCNYCRAHGGIYTSDPTGSVQFAHREPERALRYRFGHKTADFIFCGHCGGAERDPKMGGFKEYRSRQGVIRL